MGKEDKYKKCLGVGIINAKNVTVNQNIETKQFNDNQCENLKSSWAISSFYLLLFLIVMVTLGVLGKYLSPLVLSIVIVGGSVMIPIIGVLDLKRLKIVKDKTLIDLIKIIYGSLPIIGKFINKN